MPQPPVDCPCGSARTYAKCCARYIEGTKAAPIAEALMRSRYTAYSLGKIDYIINTWATETRASVDETDLATRCAETTYLKLKIVSKIGGTRKSSTGQVEFRANFSTFGKQQTHQEVSNFIKQNGRWYYVDGQVEIS